MRKSKGAECAADRLSLAVDSLLFAHSLAQMIKADEGRYHFKFRPSGSNMPSRLDRYRIPLDSLGQTIASHLA